MQVIKKVGNRSQKIQRVYLLCGMQHYGLLLRMKNRENSSVLDQTAQTAQKAGGRRNCAHGTTAMDISLNCPSV